MSDETAERREASRLARVLQSPVGDLARGRVTGPVHRVPRVKGGYRGAILDSGLPVSLAELTLRVTRATRLRRGEKLDVARELIAHFREGIAEGQTSDTLSASFGNPAQAARLIGRAKKRNRSLLWHAWVSAWKAIGVLVLFCVLLYGVLAARYWTGHPTISRNIAAELNARAMSIPESQRAWPVYREAYLALPVLPMELIESGSWPAIEPRDPQWPLLLAYVHEAEQSVDLLRRAGALPGMGAILADQFNDPEMAAQAARIRGAEPFAPPDPTPPSDNPVVMSILLPYLGNAREFSRLLSADARVALATDDGDRFMDDIEALLGLARHASENPFLIATLVGSAIDAVALDLVGKALDERPAMLSDSSLTRLAHLASAIPTETDLTAERSFFDDTIQRLYSDDGTGDGRLVGGTALEESLSGEDRQLRSGPAGPIVAALAASRSEVVAEWDRLMSIVRAESRQPMWTWTAFPGQRESDRIESSLWYRVRYFPIGNLIPAFARIAEQSNRLAMRRDAIVTAIALELWKRRHGRFPDSLAELAPTLLPQVPVDRFDGRPLKYCLLASGPVLYSVGRDRDDDGGRPPASGGSTVQTWGTADAVRQDLADPRRGPATDGDWLLWPQIHYDAEGNPIPRG